MAVLAGGPLFDAKGVAVGRGTDPERMVKVGLFDPESVAVG